MLVATTESQGTSTSNGDILPDDWIPDYYSVRQHVRQNVWQRSKPHNWIENNLRLAFGLLLFVDGVVMVFLAVGGVPAPTVFAIGTGIIVLSLVAFLTYRFFRVMENENTSRAHVSKCARYLLTRIVKPYGVKYDRRDRLDEIAHMAEIDRASTQSASTFTATVLALVVALVALENVIPAEYTPHVTFVGAVILTYLLLNAEQDNANTVILQAVEVCKIRLKQLDAEMDTKMVGSVTTQNGPGAASTPAPC